MHVVGIRVSDEQAAREEPKPRAVLILREALGARRYVPVAIGNGVGGVRELCESGAHGWNMLPGRSVR